MLLMQEGSAEWQGRGQEGERLLMSAEELVPESESVQEVSQEVQEVFPGRKCR